MQSKFQKTPKRKASVTTVGKKDLAKKCLSKDELEIKTIVEAVQKKCPSFTKSQMSMVRNPKYGVVLSAQAKKALQDVYPDRKIDSRGNLRSLTWHQKKKGEKDG